MNSDKFSKPVQEERRILIGKIGPAHGVRGEVIVHSYAAVAEDIAAYGPLSDANGSRPLAILGLKQAGDRLVARFEGVTDRNAAEALRGAELYIDRSQLPAADAGEWYHADLIGSVAQLPSGERFGTIANVVNYGGGDLLEVLPAAGGETLLLPLTDDYVPQIDIAAGIVTIILPGSIGDDEREQDG